MVDPELIKETFNQRDMPVKDRLHEIAVLGREDALEEAAGALGDLLWERQRLELPTADIEEAIERIKEL